MVIGPWVSASAERALDLARRASELAGMAFEIAFDKAGETLEPSGKALKPAGGLWACRGPLSQLGSGGGTR